MKKYEQPVFEICKYYVEDVILSSVTINESMYNDENSVVRTFN